MVGYGHITGHTKTRKIHCGHLQGQGSSVLCRHNVKRWRNPKIRDIEVCLNVTVAHKINCSSAANMSATIFFYILLWSAAQQLALVYGHGAVIGLNDGGDVTGARNWLVHTGHVDGLHEWDPYSLNGKKGRVDETSSPCGEPGQTQHGEQYRGILSHRLRRARRCRCS